MVYNRVELMLANMKRIIEGQTAGRKAFRPFRLFLFAAAFSAAYSLLSALPVLAAADPPLKFNYQGNLRQAGFLVNGTRSMVFNIYSSSNSLTPLWTSPAYNVSVSTGVFRVELVPDTKVWNYSTLWLELVVEGTALSPMEEITASPFAGNAMKLSGKRYTTSPTAPDDPNQGDLWFNSGDLKILKFWDGTDWTTGAGVGMPGIHAPTHAGGGSDPVVSLGSHTVTGDIIFSPLASLTAASGPGGVVNVASNLNVQGALNPGSNLTVGGAGYLATVVSTAVFNGYAVFKSTVQIAEGNLKIGAGPAGKVLKSLGDGFVYWGTPSQIPFNGTPFRLQMADADGNEIVDSLFLQNGADTGLPNGITLIKGSSLTVTGNFGAAGSGSFGGALDVTDIVTARNGLTVLGADAYVSDNLKVHGDLEVDGNSRLGKDTDALHSINRANEPGVALSVDSDGSSGSYAAKFYSGGTLAAWIRKK